MDEVEHLLRLLVRHHKFDFDDLRPGKVKELLFVQLMMPSEPGHGAKRRTAAKAKLIGLHQQPFPNDPMMVALTFVHVEPQE